MDFVGNGALRMRVLGVIGAFAIVCGCNGSNGSTGGGGGGGSGTGNTSSGTGGNGKGSGVGHASSGSGKSSSGSGTGKATGTGSGTGGGTGTGSGTAGTGAGTATASAGTTTAAGTGTGSTGSGSCQTDPLHTGLTAAQTGVSVDAFDCQILEWTAHYSEPDPMIFKAIIYVESRFDDTSVACPNDPCGIPSGWVAAESGCFGLMQVVPACGDQPNDIGLLPNGHPNLTTDMSSSGWAGSIFNPDVNIQTGISGVAGNRAQEKAKFPGCTEDQYTMMAIGDYNSYGSTKSCTVYNTEYDNNLVLPAYQMYAQAAGYTPHNY